MKIVHQVAVIAAVAVVMAAVAVAKVAAVVSAAPTAQAPVAVAVAVKVVAKAVAAATAAATDQAPVLGLSPSLSKALHCRALSFLGYAPCRFHANLARLPNGLARVCQRLSRD